MTDGVQQGAGGAGLFQNPSHAHTRTRVEKARETPAPSCTPCTPDPAARWRNRKERRAAWEAWESSGGTLDDLPAGLVSASLDAAMKREGAPQRWRR